MAGELRNQRLERDFGLEPCEGGAEAEVNAETEGEMAPRVTKDVEAGRVGEARFIAIGGGQ